MLQKLAFSELIRCLFGDKLVQFSAYAPNHFKATIGHFNSMFSGYLQQDSQEFLAFLLDSLHEDLNRIDKKPYVEKPSLPSTADLNDFRIVKKLADDTWKAHLLRNDSVITDLFVGLYKSTLECPECQNISITFDPYNDLTLPLPVKSMWHSHIKIFPLNAPPCILEVELPKSSSYEELKNYVATCAEIDPANLFGCEIFNNQFYTNYESPESNSKFLPLQELIAENDNVVFYELSINPNDIVVPVLNTKFEKESTRPTYFGIPFFLTLHENEVANPTLIRYKLQQMYFHLSGGFIPFPFTELDEYPNVVDLPLINEKYPGFDMTKYNDIVKYSVSKGSSSDNLFTIKIHDEGNKNHSTNNESQVCIPRGRINYHKALNMSTVLTPIVRDIYEYTSLEPKQDDVIMDDNSSNNEDSDHCNNTEETNNDEVEQSKNECTMLDTEQAEPEENHTDVTSDKDITPEENLEKEEKELPTIIDKNTIIICEWNEDGIQAAFTEDKVINWENMAILNNKELEEQRKKDLEEKNKEITLNDCLNLFSKPEILSLNDSWYCPTCKEHRQATKQIQLWNAPDVLLIHLKRFENQQSFSDKIDDVVQFPITDFDISEHLVYKDDPRGNVYDLIAVDNHYGGLGGGHYTAYAKNSTDGKWYYFDDSRVTETVAENSITGAAYLLFYLRRSCPESLKNSRLGEIVKQSRIEYDLAIKEIHEKQRVIYETNKTDDEEEEDLEDVTDEEIDADTTTKRSSSNGKEKEGVDLTRNDGSSGTRRSSDYSNESLEVGKMEIDDPITDETNAGRKKLRLIKKVYSTPSASLSPTTSTTSSDDTEDKTLEKDSV